MGVITVDNRNATYYTPRQEVTPMRYLLIVLLLLVAPTTASADEWTKTDTALQTTYAVVHLADWLQTISINKQDGGSYGKIGEYSIQYVETNPLLGKHPSNDRVNAYFATTLLLHTAISYVLPDPYRNIWQTVWIGVEAAQVVRNYNVGIRVAW